MLVNKPIYNKEDNTVLFGNYPQWIVKDIDLLNKLNNNKKDDVDIYNIDNELYKKVISLPNEHFMKLDDGTTIERGLEYFLKVEPILWDVIDEDEDSLTLKSRMILFPYHFDNESNSFNDSDLLKYLNNEFYNEAFNGVEDYMEYIGYNQNTSFDKVIIMTEDDYHKVKDKDSLVSFTDYSVLKGLNSLQPEYWLRNFSNDLNSVEAVTIIKFDSYELFSGCIYMTFYGVIPVIRINKTSIGD